MTAGCFLDDLFTTCTKILAVIQSYSTKLKDLTRDDEKEIESIDLIHSEELCLFPPSAEITAVIKDLTEQIEKLIEELRHSTNYIEGNDNYLLDFLYDYHFVDYHFTETFSMELLSIFEQNLAVFIQSIEAYRGVQNGDVVVVKNFLTQDPSSKDRPLFDGHTLLYVAAMNNQMEIMKYLIEEAKCSVNAQNLNDGPAGADTALHAACLKGHVSIIRYLLDQGANCYIKNRKGETSTMLAKSILGLYDVFALHLVLDYTRNQKQPIDLPTMNIADELVAVNYDRTVMKDNCIWEYKKVSQENWQSFNDKESNELSRHLREKSDMDIGLNFRNQIYTISMMKFFTEGNSQNSKEDYAWIRCRGSNTYNFDVIALWQIMLTKHPSTTHKEHEDVISKTINVPSVFNRDQFSYQLNSWYSADEAASKAFDEALNQRFRYLTINTFLVGMMKFNFELFSFTNESQSVQGYIRWVPKFVNVDQEAKRITPIDNFQSNRFHHNPPVPLRNKLLREFATTNDDIIDASENSAEKDEPASDITDPTLSSTADIVTMSMVSADDELANDHDEESINIEIEETDLKTLENLRNIIRDKRDDLAKNTAIMEKYQSVVRQEGDALKDLDNKKKEGQTKIDLIHKLTAGSSSADSLSTELGSLQREYENQEKILRSREDELNKCKQVCQQLEDELQSEQNKIRMFESRQRDEDQAVKEIVSIKYDMPYLDYIQVSPAVVETFLKTLNYLGKTELHEKKIKIHSDINQNNDRYHSWTLDAYAAHHRMMGAIRSRTEKFIRQIEKQKNSYRSKLAYRIRSITKTLLGLELHCSKNNWKTFLEIFQKLIDDEHEKFCQKFNVEIVKKARPMIHDMVHNVSNWWTKLPAETNSYLEVHDFLKCIEQLKQNALEQFIIKIKERIVLHSEQTKIAADAREFHLRKLQALLTSNNVYVGYGIQQFSLLSSLIHRIYLILQCYQLKLPLFESSVHLLEKIHENTVVAISTATGSGKSTLLPPLLVAEGYDKILITQPRRLPCNLLSRRVNASMNSPGVSGWAVAGARSSNSLHAPILYLTDGLLKEYLLYRESYLVKQARNSKRGIVFFIDEVHERSINIDLCLTLLARFLDKHHSIHTKVKIIISSATLDPSISQIFSKFKLHELRIETTTLHHVEIKPHCTEHMIDLVARLHQQLDLTEQILCFVKSTSEVNQMIKLLELLKNLKGYPLIQSQASSEQQKLIETKQIFFSTTVAETSLTFPSLKYVIDTGLIHMPVYDPATNITQLQELHAAESTIKQRQGRLGRTRIGQYYPLYTFNPSDKKFPTPQICQTELVQIEFSLRKSPLKCGLDGIKRWMPSSPSQDAITAAYRRLHEFDIVDKNQDFTTTGQSICKLPDFGYIPMNKAVLAALQKYNCGRDLIRLAAILSVLNTSSILRSVPALYTKTEGDFMTLVAVMDAVLAEKRIQPPHMFSIEQACENTGMLALKHVLKRAFLRYQSFEKFFDASKMYRTERQSTSHGNWEPIARALLDGYSDNVYLSLAVIQGRKHQYVRYTVPSTSGKQLEAVLDSTSKLARPLSAQPVSLVVARDIRVSSDIRNRSIISFVGEIQQEWLDRALEREITLTTKEIQMYETEIKPSANFMAISKNIICALYGNKLHLSGQAACVLATDLHVRSNLVVKQTIKLIPDNETDESLKKNVQNLFNAQYIFYPMIRRWKAEKQVKIKFSKKKDSTEVIVHARDEDYEQVKRELKSFIGWLRPCKGLQLQAGLVPRRFIDPQTKQTSSDIESRIRRITDTTLTPVNLRPRLQGPDATRETRMEVVAWVAVCLFHCKLEGGFIRDWVVANQSARPPATIARQDWVHFYNNIPAIDKSLIPSDLDCHLPIDKHFDIDRFLDEMHKYEIETEVFRQHWRYVLLFDRDYPFGPFTMDLIEPHVALTHNRIDFDVNNLYVMRDFCTELGQRVDLRNPPFSIDLEQIVAKIKKKQFRLLRPDDDIVKLRIDKMLGRGWQKTEADCNYIPPPQGNLKFVLDPLPSNSQRYQEIENEMKQIPNAKVLSIEQINSPDVFDVYHAKKKMIAGQCVNRNPNERCLFHGTPVDTAESIMAMGFDEHYFSKNGLYGHGAYFADKATKSHQYAPASAKDGNRKMFYSLVALGKIFDQHTHDDSLLAAPRDHHSIRGLANPDMVEYIVYHGSQAAPQFLITYQAP